MNKVMLARVKACALIVRVDKRDKIQAVADTMDGDIEGAAVRYVLGALKAGIRRGTYRTYEDALDAFERAQVGDRCQSLAPLSELERTVRHINYVNAQPTEAWETKTQNAAIAVKRLHKRNMAKVMGTLYVQWEDAEARNTVEYAAERAEWETREANAAEHICAYMAEYIGRLSPTAQKTVREIVASAYTVDTIMGAKHNADAERLRNKVRYLYAGFPAASAISSREFADVLKRYA